MRLANAAAQGQPGGHREFVFHEHRLRVSRDNLAIRDGRISPIIEQHAEELIVVLPEPVQAHLKAVSS